MNNVKRGFVRNKAIVTASCDRDVAQAAKHKARELGISFSALVERALDRYLERLADQNQHKEEVERQKPAR